MGSLFGLLEERASVSPDSRFIEFEGSSITYAQMYETAFLYASALAKRGVGRGDHVVLDLPQSPEVFAVLIATSMIGALAIPLNQRLTGAEKHRYLEGIEVAVFLDPAELDALQGRFDDSFIDSYRDAGSEDEPVLGMFTSGTSGRPKLAVLTQANLLGSASSSNDLFDYTRGCVWQTALPLYHVGGLMVLVRTLLAGAEAFLYERFDPHKVLDDAVAFKVTHVSVVDRMLKDLMSCDREALGVYDVIQLGGAAVDEKLLESCQGLGVYPSYGMTEAASTVAAVRADSYKGTGLVPLPGNEIRIEAPDDQGRGELLIKGPGISGRYLGVTQCLDEEGFFHTGDQAVAVGDNGFKVLERVSDLFVSGGENIYPSEIEKVLKASEGIEEVTVIGMADERWGRRPIAFVQGAAVDVAQARKLAEAELAPMKRPREYVQMGHIMDTALGKTRRPALEVMYRNRIEVSKVILRIVEQPLIVPFMTARGVMSCRRSLILEVQDARGQRGIGECSAFDSDWYMSETIEKDIATLENDIIPRAFNRAFLTAFDVSDAFEDVIQSSPLALAAFETACWDLYGRIVSRPICSLIGGQGDRVPAGKVLGIMPVEDTLAAVEAAVSRGYGRIKLKIRPGDDTDRLKAVHERYPKLMLMADANRSYSPDSLEALTELDELGLVCIEEPLATGGFEALAELQNILKTPLCLDESYGGIRDLREALTYPELRCVNMKIGKFGGLTPAMNAYSELRQIGCTIWVGGMYETGVSKRLHAAFATIPGIEIPGDIAPAEESFQEDVADTPLVLDGGDLLLGDRPGLGTDLDPEALERLIVWHREFAR